MIHGCRRRDLFIQKKKPNEIGFACTYIKPKKKKKPGMFIVYGGLGNIVHRTLWNLILLNGMINPGTLKFKPKHITDSNDE